LSSTRSFATGLADTYSHLKVRVVPDISTLPMLLQAGVALSETCHSQLIQDERRHECSDPKENHATWYDKQRSVFKVLQAQTDKHG
jgi:hypothetical protein